MTTPKKGKQNPAVLLHYISLKYIIILGHRRISLVTKIYLLLWKDLKILSSSKLSLALQIFTPLFFCCILLILRAVIKPIDIITATDYVPLPAFYTNYTNL